MTAITDSIHIPQISDKELTAKFPELKVIILKRGDSDFLVMGLDSVVPENIPAYANKTLFQVCLSTSMTYGFKFEKTALPRHSYAKKCGIYSLKNQDAQFALTLREVLAQIPPSLSKNKVFAIVIDENPKLIACGDYVQLEVTYLVY